MATATVYPKMRTMQVCFPLGSRHSRYHYKVEVGNALSKTIAEGALQVTANETNNFARYTVFVREDLYCCTLFRPFRQCFCMCLGLNEQQGMFLKSKGFLRNAGHWKKHGFETFSGFEKFEKRDNI